MIPVTATLAGIFVFFTWSLCRAAGRADAARARMVSPVPYHEYEDTDVYVCERMVDHD